MSSIPSDHDPTARQPLGPQETAPETADPASRLGHFLLYTVSLPERAVRSTLGIAAGAAREAAALLVPKSFQSSKSYEIVVCNSLRFLTEDVGGVKGNATEKTGDDAFMARKAVGNFVDLAGMATLHVSPLWVMAIVSDVAYGSRTCLGELAAELKKQGLIDETSTIDHVDDVLDAVRNASGRAAGLFDTPPLSVDELKQSLDETRQAIQSVDFRGILPEAELSRYWNEMKTISAAEDVSLLGVSGALTMHTLDKMKTVTRGAATSVEVVGGLLNKHVVGHYANALKDIREKGFYQSLHETSAPYIEAVWNNFAGDKSTLTEEVVTGRAFGKLFGTVKGWFSNQQDETPAPPPASDAESSSTMPNDSARQKHDPH